MGSDAVLPPTAPQRQPTRTETILAIVRRQLAERATIIDAANDLSELHVSVRLHAGTNVVTSVQVTEERFFRRRT